MKKVLMILLCCFILFGCESKEEGETKSLPEEDSGSKYENVTTIPYDKIEYDGETFSLDYIGFFELESDSGYGYKPCAIVHFDFSPMSDEAFYWLTKDNMATQYTNTFQVHSFITNKENGLDGESFQVASYKIDEESKTGSYLLGIDKEFKNGFKNSEFEVSVWIDSTGNHEDMDMYNWKFGGEDGDFELKVEELTDAPEEILEQLFGDEKADVENESEDSNVASNNASKEDSNNQTFDYYPSGQYKVGSDIDSGEYVLLSENDDGFFSVNSDANGNDIIFNGGFDINSIITVNEGEFLELRRCIAVKYDDFYPDNSIKIEMEGIMIKVGNEIDAGEYKIEGEDGFYSIYSDSRREDIISNGSVKGSAYIQVEDGQYLELRRCKIVDKTS